VDLLNGVAVTAGHEPDSVLLWFLRHGWWQSPVAFSAAAGHSVSMDRRLREVAAALPEDRGTPVERQEHLALLARWYYSSWRDGAWIEFESTDRLPWRRMVSAVSRTVHQSSSAASH
jgi:excinuclease ABC subunit C